MPTQFPKQLCIIFKNDRSYFVNTKNSLIGEEDGHKLTYFHQKSYKNITLQKLLSMWHIIIIEILIT